MTEIASLRLIAEQLEIDQALAYLVERMRTSTGATAAAIALVDGGEIVCRASSGNAPSVGARVDPESGFSGECVRTGQTVRCEDTETDGRADRLVCRRWNLRSIVIVPILSEGRLPGILEIFSAQPHAFDSGHELALGQIAELVAEIALRPPEATPTLVSQKLMAAAMMEPLLAEPQRDDKTLPPTKQNKEITPEEPIVQSPAMPVKAERKAQRAEMATVAEPEAKPVAAIVAPEAPVAQPPAATPKQAKTEAAPTALLAATVRKLRSRDLRTGFAAREAELSLLGLSRLKLRISGAAILLLPLLVVGVWQSRRAITPANTLQTETQVKQAEPAPVTVLNPRVLAVKTTTAAAKPEATPAQEKPPRPARTITLPAPDMGGSAAPPVITVVANNAEALPIANLLAAPVAAPKLDTAAVSQVTGGKLIKKVDPISPSSMAFTNGEVVLKATINRKGEVAKVEVVRGQAILALAATSAVMRWRYEPFQLNGVPIEVQSEIVINFKWPRQ